MPSDAVRFPAASPLSYDVGAPPEGLFFARLLALALQGKGPEAYCVARMSVALSERKKKSTQKGQEFWQAFVFD